MAKRGPACVGGTESVEESAALREASRRSTATDGCVAFALPFQDSFLNRPSSPSDCDAAAERKAGFCVGRGETGEGGRLTSGSCDLRAAVHLTILHLFPAASMLPSPNRLEARRATDSPSPSSVAASSLTAATDGAADDDRLKLFERDRPPPSPRWWWLFLEPSGRRCEVDRVVLMILTSRSSLPCSTLPSCRSSITVASPFTPFCDPTRSDRFRMIDSDKGTRWTVCTPHRQRLCIAIPRGRIGTSKRTLPCCQQQQSLPDAATLDDLQTLGCRQRPTDDQTGDSTSFFPLSMCCTDENEEGRAALTLRWRRGEDGIS